MARKVTSRMTYEADVEAVHAMYIDPDYVQAKNEKTGGRNVTVEVTPDGDGTKIVAHRELPADIPAFAKKFVGETVQVTETDYWGPPNADGSRDGTIKLDFGSSPVAAHGTLRLEAGAEGCACEAALEIKSSVPLVGGKIEGVTADQIERAVGAEEKLGREWLAKS